MYSIFEQYSRGISAKHAYMAEDKLEIAVPGREQG
jgi:hypothetical protein